MKRSRIPLLACGLALAAAPGLMSRAQAPQPPAAAVAPPAADLEAFVQARLDASGVPGLAAGIIKQGKLVWAKGCGFANAEEKRPATPDTLFMLASVSKTVVAVAALKLVEEGKLDLDADVSTYLPFPVRVPGAAEAPVTTRMLLTHTAGLKDNWNILNATYGDGDSPIPLGDYLKDYLVPGGKYFSRARNFQEGPPLTICDYTNEGVALAAYVIERAAQMPFDRFCRERIFRPLGMAATTHRFAEVDPAKTAMPYNRKTPLGHYGYADYPAGTIRSSVNEFSRFLIMFMQGGELDGTRILQRTSVEAIKTAPYPALDPKQGLIWAWTSRDGQTYLGHRGRDKGVHTLMRFRPSDGAGILILTNGDLADPEAARLVDAVEAKLFEASAQW